MDTPTPASEPALQTRLAQRLAHMVDEADHLLHTNASRAVREHPYAAIGIALSPQEIFVTNAYPGGYWEDQGYNWFGGS